MAAYAVTSYTSMYSMKEHNNFMVSWIRSPNSKMPMPFMWDELCGESQNVWLHTMSIHYADYSSFEVYSFNNKYDNYRPTSCTRTWISHLPEKGMPRSYTKAPCAQKMFQPIPGPIYHLHWGDQDTYVLVCSFLVVDISVVLKLLPCRTPTPLPSLSTRPNFWRIHCGLVKK